MRRNLRGLALGAVLLVLVLGAAPEAGPWEPVSPPDTGGGLVIAPRLESSSGRLHLFWGWTNQATKIVEPEFTYASLSGDTWTTPRPPYFGDNLGRVRRIAAATAKQSVGVIFQRQLDQAKNAFEVLYTISGDGGWSYMKPPGVADSYNHEGTTGTAVAIAGVGGRRPGFAVGWLTEGNTVRVGVLDPKSNSDRPRTHNVGTHSSRAERLEMCGEDGGGFLAAWFDGAAVKAVRLKPIVGEPDPATTVVSGSVGSNFALADRGGRNPLLVVRASGLEVFRFHDDKWEKVAVAAAQGGDGAAPRQLEAAQDEDGFVHVVSYPGSGDALLYQTNRGGRWSRPEAALKLNENLGVTGFDVVVHEGSVYVVAAQGPHLAMSRRRIGE